MTIANVKIIEHSVNKNGIEIVTFQLRYWRAIHSEVMTHRVFSRNASSSRAIPVKTVLKQVWNEPAGPIHWGANQPGMQANEQLSGWKNKAAQFLWNMAAKAACVIAYLMMQIGLHKQVANRILEPFQFISVVMTTTELDNWFELRNHEDAQPEIKDLAQSMLSCLRLSTPRKLKLGEWHLPYIRENERQIYYRETLCRMSAARCARTSYLTHDGQNPDREKDLGLFDRLVGSKPFHASPTEHQATPADDKSFYKNFRGWIQFREHLGM